MNGHRRYLSLLQDCLTLPDILKESRVTLTGGHHRHHDDPHADLHTVFGVILYHVLLGNCITSRSLPAEHFFLDYVFTHFGPDNITVQGATTACSICSFML